MIPHPGRSAFTKVQAVKGKLRPDGPQHGCDGHNGKRRRDTVEENAQRSHTFAGSECALYGAGLLLATFEVRMRNHTHTVRDGEIVDDFGRSAGLLPGVPALVVGNDNVIKAVPYWALLCHALNAPERSEGAVPLPRDGQSQAHEGRARIHTAGSHGRRERPGPEHLHPRLCAGRCGATRGVTA